MKHFLELLEQKFPGVRKDVLAQLAASLALVATTEDEQNVMVEKLDEAQVEAFGKEYRKTVDTEVKNGTKTFEENLKKKFDFVEKGGKEPQKEPAPQPIPQSQPQPKPTPATEPQSQPQPKKEEDDEKFKAMQKRIEELEGMVTGMKKEGISKTRKSMYSEIISACKDGELKSIFERQFPLLEALDDEAFNSQLDAIKGEVDKSNQRFAEKSLPTNTFVRKQPANEDAETKAATDAMVKKLNLP